MQEPVQCAKIYPSKCISVAFIERYERIGYQTTYDTFSLHAHNILNHAALLLIIIHSSSSVDMAFTIEFPFSSSLSLSYSYFGWLSISPTPLIDWCFYKVFLYFEVMFSYMLRWCLGNKRRWTAENSLTSSRCNLPTLHIYHSTWIEHLNLINSTWVASNSLHFIQV